MSVQTYFAVGSTLAAMVNLEATYSLIANALPDALVPLTGGVRRRTLSGTAKHNGWASSVLRVDFASQAHKRAFMYAVFGGNTTASVNRYMTLVDEDGYYSPFSVIIDKPAFSVVSGGYLRGVEFVLTDCTLQTANKTANFTVTTSTRHLTADTTSGSITFALPAVAGVNAYTVFSFIKTAAANSMILDPNSTELIENASTLTVASQYERVDVYSDGSQWRRI